MSSTAEDEHSVPDNTISFQDRALGAIQQIHRASFGIESTAHIPSYYIIGNDGRITHAENSGAIFRGIALNGIGVENGGRNLSYSYPGVIIIVDDIVARFQSRICDINPALAILPYLTVFNNRLRTGGAHYAMRIIAFKNAVQDGYLRTGEALHSFRIVIVDMARFDGRLRLQGADAIEIAVIK
jgi:hypothetical protein